MLHWRRLASGLASAFLLASPGMAQETEATQLIKAAGGDAIFVIILLILHIPLFKED
jgi:hypothetical protein